MIDWWMVGTNSLWIVGLSILFAALSYHDWLAKETGQRRRELFRATLRAPAVCRGDVGEPEDPGGRGDASGSGPAVSLGPAMQAC